MNDHLHPWLLLLTLIDLGFVLATGAVSPLSLLPLGLFAFASLRLRRLQAHRTYRVAWNLVVLVVFALLVHHATTTGLLHMLEDGLILAVLCQVHLINNIGDKQRPDLTFFNSFLIAFVTSFFAPDAWWSVLFVAHAFAFVPGLQVYVLTSRGRTLTKEHVWQTIRDSGPRTVTVVAVTALVFLFWPRDFAREGWLKDNLAFGEQLQVGLSERIELEQNGPVHLGDEIALRIEAVDGSLDAIPSHWRGTVFSTFDGQTWYPQYAGDLGSRYATDSQWQRRSDGTWTRPARGAVHTWLRVRQLDLRSAQLLLPIGAVQLEARELRGLMLDPKSFGGFRVLPIEGDGADRLSYTVGLSQPAPAQTILPGTVEHFAQLPTNGVPRLAYDMSDQLREQLPHDADAMALANSVCAWLQQNRRYQLPGESGFARNLGEFLLGSAAGHCEYFATTMALLLRCQGVPCRLVGGYLVHEDSDGGAARIARARDAHAWVEVLAADGSWHTFDPTPAADLDRARDGGSGWLHDLSTTIDALWAEVTGFDEQGRARLLQRLVALPTQHPFAMAVVALLVAVIWHRRRRRRRQIEPSIAALQRTLRRARIALLPGETPRELLARVAGDDRLPPNVIAELELAQRRHELARYR